RRSSDLHTPDFYGIAFTLQHGAAFGELHGFVHRLGTNYDISPYSFLDIAEGTVGYHFVMMEHPCVVEGQTIAQHILVLRRYTADPAHRRFHPFLDLFRGGHLTATLMPEDQHEFVHFLCSLVIRLN